MNPAVEGLLAGLLDSRAEYGGLLLWSAQEAEGHITFGKDLTWLAEEGFLS